MTTTDRPSHEFCSRSYFTRGLAPQRGILTVSNWKRLLGIGLCSRFQCASPSCSRKPVHTWPVSALHTFASELVALDQRKPPRRKPKMLCSEIDSALPWT